MVEEFLFDKIVDLDNENKETPTTTLGSNTGFLGENPTHKGKNHTEEAINLLRKFNATGFSLCTRVFTHVVGVSNDVGRDYSGQVTDLRNKNAINFLRKFNSTGDGFEKFLSWFLAVLWLEMVYFAGKEVGLS